MHQFEVHHSQTAPEGSKARLQGVAKSFGFIPNLAGILAESPAALEAYFTLAGIFEKTSLTPTQRQIVLLAVSRANGCDYCMAAHTVGARMQRVPELIIEALRCNQRLRDPRLEALRTFATDLIRQRGWLEDTELQAFFDAGYTRQNVLEVIVGVAMKTLSNYTNHIAATPLDDAFSTAAWSPEECTCQCAVNFTVV